MYKMDSHIHCEYSPDSKSKLEDIFKVAKSRNIDIIAISDHNTVEGSKEAQRLTKNDDNLLV
ncbi:MAG: PHP domain-containing protein, partial [Methanobrevibacter sp.]|nr:PHP domain-containing protein [Methanobrevibacter sp.]